jgi:hypothetical protein
MSSRKTSTNRRDFLKIAAGAAGGLMFSDLLRLYTGIHQTLLNQAMASVAPAMSKNYIQFHLAGGPARWVFDQWLTPNPTDVALNSAATSLWNPGVATAINGAEYTYRLMNYKGVQVPHHFGVNVDLPSGAVPLSNLLDSMAVIRGMNSRTDGHEPNGPIHCYPDPAAPSLNGLAADGRNDRISGILSSTNQYHPFASAKSKTAMLVSDQSQTAKGGSLYGLMKSFQRSAKGAPGLQKLDVIRAVVEEFEAATKQNMNRMNLRGSALADHLKNTRELTLMAAQDLLVADWNTLFNKYTTIMNSAVRLPYVIPGLTDQAQFTPATGEKRFYNPVSSTSAIDPSFDLRSMLTNATMSANLVRSFVLAEYCLTKQISGSLVLGAGDHLSNLSIKIEGEASARVTTSFNDQHEIPFRVGTLVNTAFFRGFGAGLLELRNSLQAIPSGAGNLFDDTVIHITGDFPRSPTYNPTNATTLAASYGGTDHGWMGQTVTLISGAIEGPMIVGNITGTHAYSTSYKGLWGVGSDVDFNGTKELLSPRHVAAVVAHLLGGANPWSFTNLVYRLDSNGKLQPAVQARIT